MLRSTLPLTILSLLIALPGCGSTSPAGAGGSAATGTGGGSATTGATGGESASATSSGAGGGAAVVSTYDAAPGVLANQVKEGFCEPELYAKTVDGATQYWLRDNVAAYGDPRPRAFYVDFGYVGSKLDYGPIVRGGVYSVRCLRFAGDLWWQQPGTMESHVVWFRVPGPMMEPGQVPVPQSFQIEDNFIVNQVKLLPKFDPIEDKTNLVYRWWEKDTLDDMYDHGATHISANGNPGELDQTKLGYMAPEQFRGKEITRSVDVYAASIVLWELLTGKRLFAAESQAATIERVLFGSFQPPTDLVPGLPAELDAILERGLARAPEGRFADARAMAGVIEACLGVASMSEVATWIGAVAGPELKKRAELVAAIELESEAAPIAIASLIASGGAPAPPPPPRISTPTLPMFAPKPAEDTATTVSPTIAARAPEGFVDARSTATATAEFPKRSRRRALVAGGVSVAAIVAVAALAASTSAPAPMALATPAPAISAAPEDSSAFRAADAPSAAPSIGAPAEIRPAIKRPAAPPSTATRSPGARKKTASSSLPADLPSERN